jgi:hypothetical protein
MNILLLNAPPSAGKDTVAKFMVAYFNRKAIPWHFLRMSHPNKRAFAGLVDAPIDRWGNVDEWEGQKDLPSELLGGKTYREWQIGFSESFMKPTFGNDIFGRLFVNEIEKRLLWSEARNWPGYVIVPDLGFDIEATTVRDLLPDARTLIIHIKRPGANFSNDSRSYISPPGMALTSLHNDGNLEQLKIKSEWMIKDWGWTAGG